MRPIDASCVCVYFDPTCSYRDGLFRCRKLWQNLGDMDPEQAKIWFIHVVTDIAPEWRNPPRTDSALLVSGTSLSRYPSTRSREHVLWFLPLLVCLCSEHGHRTMKATSARSAKKRLRSSTAVTM